LRFLRPLIFTYHTRYEKYAHYIPFARKLAERKAIQWSIAFSNHADLVIAPSRNIAKTLVEYGVKRRIEVVPTGVNLALFAPGDRLEARQSVGLPLHGTMLLFVGRLDREKNIGFLLRVFQIVGSKDPSVFFVLVGQGKEEHRLRTAAAHLSVSTRILFTGPAPPEKVAKYHQASDLFVFASETETQGLAVSEAQAAGLPVVAVRASGVEEAVRSGETGLLLPPKVDEFAEALQSLLQNPSVRSQMGLQARQIALAHYSEEQSVARHLELYAETLSSPVYLT
jgi:glycosyltransferase involved in cell wall biosynthesis